MHDVSTALRKNITTQILLCYLTTHWRFHLMTKCSQFISILQHVLFYHLCQILLPLLHVFTYFFRPPCTKFIQLLQFWCSSRSSLLLTHNTSHNTTSHLCSPTTLPTSPHLTHPCSHTTLPTPPYLTHPSQCISTPDGIACAERDGTRAGTRFCLSPRRTSPFKSVRASVQSTAGSRSVRISLSNAGYTTFGVGVRVLTTHSIRQFPLHFPSRASPCATRFRTSSPTHS